MYDNDADIYIITETWLDSSVKDSEFTPDGYTPFRRDRDISFYSTGTYVTEDRGGVLILCKDNLYPVEYESATVDAEILWIQISPFPKFSYLIGGCYRPERDELNMIRKINASINKINTTNIILAGDFNFRRIDWNSLDSSKLNEVESSFVETLQDNFLHQMVNKPTRGRNILDLVITGSPDDIEKWEVCPPFSSSDHDRVEFYLRCPVTRMQTEPRKVYLYSKGNYEALNDEVLKIDWTGILSPKSIEDKWSNFKSEYERLVDSHVPSKWIKCGRRNKPPWSRYKSVNHAKKNKRHSWVRQRESGLNADKFIYDEVSREKDRSMLAAKAHYENKLFESMKDNPKRVFNYAKFYSKSSSTIHVLEREGEKIADDPTKAEMLNDYFISVLTDEPEILNSLPEILQSGPYTLLDVDVSPEIVRKKLQKLKHNKGIGPDGISTNILQQCLDFDVPLSMLFQTSIRMSQIPQDWRDAHVVPLFKKGSKTRCSNYRPVSLTSHIMKVLERILNDSVIDLAMKNNFYSCHQHGFQANCSCLTQLLECLNDWTECEDNNIQVDSIYLDFAKAFDSVPHKRLLYKLRRAGIKGQILLWMEQFLNNRRQRVILRSGKSSWKPVTSGVPQGSILGPTLFLIYINDLPDAVSNVAKLFADDTKLYGQVRTVENCHSIQMDLNALASWSRTWLLRFNATKCVVLKIKKSIEYTYTLNGICLESVSEQKDLGVIVSDKLTPHAHIASIVKKANQRIGLLKRCFTDLTEFKVRTYYQTMVRPLLEYCSPSWSPWTKNDIVKLEKVQERCLKLSNTKIELESLDARRKKQDLCEVYKYVHGDYKIDASTLFRKSDRTARSHQYKLFKPRANKNVRSNFFSHRVVDRWNSLSADAVSATSLNSFKRHLRSLPIGEEG